MAEAVIKAVRTVPGTKSDRLGKLDTMVAFTVEGHGLNTLFLHKDNPTDEEIKTAVKERAKQISNLAGTKVAF
jgi:hypothetical protein